MVKDVSSQITFLYYEDLEEAQHFMGSILELQLAKDEGWAKIYQVNKNAFLGVVDEDKGVVRRKGENAVVITLCVSQLENWYNKLKQKEVKILKDISDCSGLSLKNFFIKGPGNYMFEFLEYSNPESRLLFHS